MSIKIRTIKVSDTRKLVKILKTVKDSAKGKWLEKSIPEHSTEDKAVKSDMTAEEAGVKIFDIVINLAVDTCCEDLTEWFASLVGVSVDEYLELPMDTDMVVAQQIKESKEFTNFFSIACAAFNFREKFENMLSIVKQRLDSLID